MSKTAFSRYIKAYLQEVDGETQTRIEMSKKPFTPEQFFPIVMGIMEAYAQELLSNNAKEDVYANFNNVFGTFLTKLVPEDYIYEHSEEHKKYKKTVNEILSQPEDKAANEENRLAAYLLCADILTKEIGLSKESADLILNRRLGTLKVAEHAAEE